MLNFSLSYSSVITVWTRRAKQLEKELAVLKEKIHHLDDMLKCQQRKVRHMIEQVRQNYLLSSTGVCVCVCVSERD